MNKKKKVIIYTSVILAICLVAALIIFISINKTKKDLASKDGIDTTDISEKLESFLNIYGNEEKTLADYLVDGKIYVDNNCKTTLNPVANDKYVTWELSSDCQNENIVLNIVSLKENKIIMSFIKDNDSYIIAYKDNKVSSKITIASVNKNGTENWTLPYELENEESNIEITDIKKDNDLYYLLGYIGGEDNSNSILLELKNDGTLNKEYDLNKLASKELATYYKIGAIKNESIYLLGETSMSSITNGSITEINISNENLTLEGYAANKYYGIETDENGINYFLQYDEAGNLLTKTNINDLVEDDGSNYNIKKITKINNNYLLVFNKSILILNESGELVKLIDYNNMEFLGSKASYSNIENVIVDGNEFYTLIYPNSNYLVIESFDASGKSLNKKTYNNVSTYPIYTDSDDIIYSYENNTINADYLLAYTFQTIISINYKN